jgi:hypothetical protein
MSLEEKFLEVVVNLSEDIGGIKSGQEDLKNDMSEIRSDIADLKNKWYSNVDWVKAGKGIGYVLLSMIVAGGGVAGLDKWLGIFK